MDTFSIMHASKLETSADYVCLQQSSFIIFAEFRQKGFKILFDITYIMCMHILWYICQKHNFIVLCMYHYGCLMVLFNGGMLPRYFLCRLPFPISHKQSGTLRCQVDTYHVYIYRIILPIHGYKIYEYISMNLIN